MTDSPATTQDIVGLGLAIVDVVLRLEQMPRWESPGTLRGFALADGGPAGTACAVASLLGEATGFIDTFGNDAMAEHKMHALRSAGLDLTHMVSRDAPENHIAIAYVNANNGDRVFSFLPEFLAKPVLIEELDRDYITAAQVLHLDSFHSEAVLQAAKWMREAGKTVVLDAAATNREIPEPLRALVKETDILISGSGFCNQLTGQEDLAEAGRAALDAGPSVVVQTEGAEGSYTFTKDEEFHTPAFEVDVVDTTGAGDVFHGAYLVGLVRGWGLERRARFASAVSAIHCTVLGNRKGIPTMEETLSFLKDRDFPQERS